MDGGVVVEEGMLVGGRMGLEGGIEVGEGAGVGCMRDGLGVRGCRVGSGGGGRECLMEAGVMGGGGAEGIERYVDVKSESIPQNSKGATVAPMCKFED